MNDPNLTVRLSTPITTAPPDHVAVVVQTQDLLDEIALVNNRRLREVALTVTESLQGMIAAANTELRHTQQERDLAARTDAQTGLLNGRAFEDALALKLGDHPDNRVLSVVCVRFDRIDEFLAPLTSAQQQLVLDTVIERLGEFMPHQLLSRWGKWEFAGITELGASAEQRHEALATHLNRLRRSLKIDAFSIPLFPKMGATCGSGWDTSAGQVLHQAETALLTATHYRQFEPLWFDTGMETMVADQVVMAQEIRRGILNDEFELQYQPIIDQRGRPLRKAEALIRWNHPEKGRLGPNAFLPLAESYGHIIALTDWVIRRAARQSHVWRKTLDSSFQISVNIPPTYLEWCARQPSDALSRMTSLDCPPEGMLLEITEGAMLNVTASILYVLNQLKSTGFEVALDDFGVGYSCFAQLDRLPLDTLKIDKSLIDNIESATRKMTVCKAIIELGHECGLKVVAEGVESAGQLALLSEAGCDFIQGYIYSRPLCPVDFEAFATSFLASPNKPAAT